MSLHPGEQGVCATHGVYDEFCGKCVDDRRATYDRRTDERRALDQQAKPTGDGAVVLDHVKQWFDLAIARYSLPTALLPIIDVDNLRLLYADLEKRSNMGAKKYGTPLRLDNGRDPLVDLYQEVQDAIMYSRQGHLQGDKSAGSYFELLVQIGSTIAGELQRRAIAAVYVPATTV